MNSREKDCTFCHTDENRVVLENRLALAIRDAFPVTPLHVLVIPRRHTPDYFSLTKDEVLACDALLREARERIEDQDPSVEGFNIGLNVGTAAGQTIFHCHYHLIPRRVGDVENPRGGIRHMIPGKGDY